MGRGFTALIAGLLLALLACGAGRAAPDFLPGMDPAPLQAAIDAERPQFTPPAGVTGLIVPHHLLAATLIARGFWAASAGDYTRVVVLSPDHFRALTTPFATTDADLATAFGTVAIDRAATDGLVDGALVARLPDVAHEHGVMAIAPFVKQFFPRARIVPVLAAITASPADWAAMAERLKSLAGPDTLIVQSTDFSHYRALSEAIARDQESLTAIMANDPAGVARLLQPEHLDSKAALSVQMTLQTEVYGARPVVIGNANSADFGTGTRSTTSYVTVAYVTREAAGTALAYPDQSRVMLAGDVLLGRYLAPLLHDKAAWAAVRDAALAASGGVKLIVNLEGVLLDRRPTGVGADALVMTSDDAAGMLAALNVTGASLANNHANDLGPDGRAATMAELQRLDIRPLTHGQVEDFGAFRLLPINMVRGRFTGEAIAAPDDLDWVCALDAAPPVVAFMHWGSEYVTTPGPEQMQAAAALQRCGVSAVVGAHSHQASDGVAPLGGGAGMMVYSAGNFLFDQSAPRGSGQLVELRVFRHGTLALRPVPVPNLFDVGRRALP